MDRGGEQDRGMRSSEEKIEKVEYYELKGKNGQ
jgi:hypothetical protein